MSTQRPHFLITNDDGIHSVGIRELWLGLKDFADITIVAPDCQKSATGLGVTIHNPLQVTSVKWEDEATIAYKVSGTPADCVRVAVKHLAVRPFDLVLSGINHGSNSGRTVLYSGTIGGVIQGTFLNIKGIAFSNFHETNEGFSHLKQYLWPIVEYLFKLPTPKGTFFNVNFPEHPEENLKGFKMATQGFSTYDDTMIKVEHPDGYHLYHPTSTWAPQIEPNTSDVHWLNEGYITASPISVEEMTNTQLFLEHKDHFENHFSPLFK